MKMNSTILLVEDNQDDVFLMKRALKGAALSNPLKIVEDGQQAINYLAGVGEFADRAQFPVPSLVFLDLKLPYKGGFDVLEWIRNQPAMETPVVVLTSSSEEKDIKESSRLGAKSFLVKPPTPEMLAEVLVSLNH